MRKPSEIKINEYTLEEILVRHLHWLNEDCDGWVNMRADLCNADLSYAYLCNANLRYADLTNANLCGANLRDVNLRDANLCNANLCGANLRDVNLRNAFLCSADLHYVNLCNGNLSYANLTYTNLRNADLCNADLSYAYLCNANLRYANLCCADLHNANLHNVDLCNAENIPYIPLACPSEGSFIAWKKVKDYLVKLEIPESAKRSSGASNKCRASEAKVLGIYRLDGIKTNLIYIINTAQESELNYIVGKTVYPDSFDENRWDECSHGIHFFVDKQDAIDYCI